ncbi:MAG: hypothetical protein WDA27_10095 [Actinomycetota bacterium]
MRKLITAVALMGALIGMFPATPAPAAEVGTPPGNFVFPVAGTIPCGVGVIGVADICAYNIPENLYKACENPFPPGSYVDIVTKPAPKIPDGKRKVILQLESFPQVDWDTFICGMLSDGSHNGGEMARGANAFAEPCDNLQGPESLLPVGCKEKAMSPVEPGKQYVLRAYNWMDVADCPARYSWIFL